MQNKHKLAVALGFLALIGTVEVAQARISAFSGTRSQVRGACTGPGRGLIEGIDNHGIGWSHCYDMVRGTSVNCDDSGSCLGFTPRVGSVKRLPRRPRSNYEPPASLSEPSSGSMDPPIDAPAPDPVPDVVIIN